MDISLDTIAPGFKVEPTRLFAHTTHLINVYTPQVEQIIFPGEERAETHVHVNVTQKETWEMRETSWKRKAFKKLVNLGVLDKPLNLGDDFVFDARFDTERNVSHVLENVCTSLLYAKRILSEHLGKSINIHVILIEKASPVAKEMYEALQIPVICTNQKVFANVVTVKKSSPGGLQALQPELFRVTIDRKQQPMAERVFIGRKGNRRLLNHDEVQQFLEHRGFVTYYFEDLNFYEKLALTQNAKVAVVVHGAGTANFIFNRVGLAEDAAKGSGLRLIELFSACYTIPSFQYLGTLLNGKWCAVRGRITPEIMRYLDFDKSPRNSEKSPIRDPYAIDLAALEMALEYMDVDTVSLPVQQLLSR